MRIVRELTASPADRVDVRLDRRAGIDHGRFAQEIRTRAVKRERAGIRRGELADLHGSTVLLLTRIGRRGWIRRRAARRAALRARRDCERLEVLHRRKDHRELSAPGQRAGVIQRRRPLPTAAASGTSGTAAEEEVRVEAFRYSGGRDPARSPHELAFELDRRLFEHLADCRVPRRVERAWLTVGGVDCAARKNPGVGTNERSRVAGSSALRKDHRAARGRSQRAPGSTINTSLPASPPIPHHPVRVLSSRSGQSV